MSIEEIGIYSYLSDIDKDSMFKYIIVSVLIIMMVHIIYPSLMSILGIVAAFIVILIANEKRVSTISSTNKEMEYRLRSLYPQPDYFYINTNVINFFYNINDLREYNKQAYTDALLEADNLLRLVHDSRIGIHNCSNNIDVANGFKSNSLNYINSLKNSVPIGILSDKLDKGLKNLHLELTRMIDEMTSTCMNSIIKDGKLVINHTTRFPKIYDGPTGTDKNHDDPFYVY